MFSMITHKDQERMFTQIKWIDAPARALMSLLLLFSGIGKISFWYHLDQIFGTQPASLGGVGQVTSRRPTNGMPNVWL